ncbi:cytochrome-c peroxidase [Parapusillimonas granuli]|uniref:Cytochrome-c peroxidase n=1 Tax=Parapusillimonas granuli TaxID=380911 RepID=A0A853G1U7_9BURK|nr:cytochrome-c peroxidase [Parapusillimonas granuli]MBB5214602.1 cytochrome c peroxidase [Parapusillimonas granuli]NYT48990.1 cytochrome-c peroxidase [Parapusillimonas granuli]
MAFGVQAAAASTPSSEQLRKTASSLFKPIPEAQVVIKDRNLSVDQIELGKWLFFEPRLSKSHIISCNTCHSVGTGGADNIPTSIGHGWQAGPRNSPTVLNAVFNIAQFWDGRAADLKEQAKGPVQASVEMNATPKHVEETLRSIPEYVEFFAKAFPGEKDPVTFDNMAKAIEAFESTLVTPNSRFDQWLAGKETLSNHELNGLNLFINKGCVACHSGINVGGQGYFPFGVIKRPGAEVLPAGDKGRFAVTNTASDEYVFRAGPLRNIALTAPYFHSGEVWDLEQAVAIMGSSQLGHELNTEEVKAITAFLHTLTGEQPRVEYPILPRSTPATPRPAQ